MKPSYSLFKNFGYSFAGIAQAFKTGTNIRIQSAVGVLAIVLGFVFGITPEQWLAVVICIGLVLGGECFNSALEAVVDLASPEYHDLAKAAKDMAAGAVMIFAAASFVVGCIIFVPYLLSLVGW
ncbi:MAG: diacylglycerol kinase family protein [Eggerthellales bacterium]|nr:diacylglycerol kinase family protein [Eggerthellales bacterium]